MSVKIIFFVLTGIILMYGTLVNANHEEVRRKCAMHRRGPTFEMCILIGHGVLNENGEWDKKKLEDLLKETRGARGDLPAGVMAELMKCVDEGTGETLFQKTENFFKCADRIPHEDRNFV